MSPKGPQNGPQKRPKIDPGRFQPLALSVSGPLASPRGAKKGAQGSQGPTLGPPWASMDPPWASLDPKNVHFDAPLGAEML